MSELDPDIYPEAWDNALIGDKITPGICIISGGARNLQYDKGKGYGTSGATTKFVGADLTEFDLKIIFVDGVFGLSAVEQRAQYEAEILPQYKACEDGKTALYFYHPAVSEPPINVTAVVPKKIGQYEREGDVWVVKTTFTNFSPPKPAAGTPKGAKKKPAGGGEPLDENQKQIEALKKELASLV